MEYAAGDRSPSVQITVTRGGAAEDLSGRAFVADINRGPDTIERTLVAVNLASGVLRLDWQDGDLVDDAGGRAHYRVEVVLDKGTATQETARPFDVYVRPRVGVPV